MGRPEGRDELVAQSNIARVILTNQYNDDLEGLDTSFYTPCLRTEPFILWMDRPAERESMGAFLGRPIRTIADFRSVIQVTFDEFMNHGIGYAAMSIPANFQTFHVADEDAARLLERALAGSAFDADEARTWGAWAMSCIADACRQFGKPYHLMIGVNRDVYAHGVPMGMDLFDATNSMRGYDYLFNAYPDVSFPTAVLDDTTGLELSAADWIVTMSIPPAIGGTHHLPRSPARCAGGWTRPGYKPIGYFYDAYYSSSFCQSSRCTCSSWPRYGGAYGTLPVPSQLGSYSPWTRPWKWRDLLNSNPASIIGIPGSEHTQRRRHRIPLLSPRQIEAGRVSFGNTTGKTAWSRHT
jgi:hypothetical protein